jgi:cellulose synthase/poly-beta-1,6-N-acetylglucosamine synthase-like glycosyltransferase
LDSDEILPENYLYESLRYFYAYGNVGLVQANHISDRNRNFFMKLFHIGVNSHWPTYQTMKHFYGFSTMLGHGAMIKRECYEKAGGFPPLVAEDLCLSIEARNAGYFVAFAPNIICREEYPVDYVAFKKRHSKWTQGNLEFIKKYTGKISKSKMRWFEKMDIVLFTYNLPLTAVFAFFIFVNLTVAPLLGVNLGKVYAPWMIIPTIVFFFSPMLNDFIQWAFRLNPLRTLIYTLSVVALYGFAEVVDTAIIKRKGGEEPDIPEDLFIPEDEDEDEAETVAEADDVWICPSCEGEVTYSEETKTWHCAHCHRMYQVVGKGWTQHLKEV